MKLFQTPKYLSLFLLLALGPACTYQYSVDATRQWVRRLEVGDQYTIFRQRAVVIPADVDFCVSGGVDIFNEAPIRQLTEQMELALKSRVGSLTLLDASRDADSALDRAYRQHCQFLLYPRLVKNIDKASSLSELDEIDGANHELGFDRQWLQLNLWDVNSRKVADVAVIKSRNGFFTFAAHKPEDLLPATLNAYADGLFAMNRYR